MRKQEAKRIPILEVASKVGVRVKGKVASCINPEHTDANPSMSFDTKKNIFKCFSCGLGGDTIKLVQTARGLDFNEAVGFLVGFDDDTGSNGYKQDYKHTSKPKKAVYRAVERSYKQKSINIQTTDKNANESKNKGLDFSRLYNTFTDMLDIKEAVEYLDRRGIIKDVTLEFGIKTIPKGGVRVLVERLKKMYGTVELEGSGLVRGEYLTLGSHRLVIPYKSGGRIVNLQGRNIDDDSKPKYKFLPNISPSLFNDRVLDLEHNPIKKVLICEGVMDTLTVYMTGLWHEYGLPLGVAGVNSWSGNLMERLKGFDVTMLAQNDKAGLDFYSRFRDMYFRKYNTYPNPYICKGNDFNDDYMQGLA